MFPKGEARGKHLVIGPEREIYSNVSRKIMQQLFCHIGYLTHKDLSDTQGPDAETFDIGHIGF